METQLLTVESNKLPLKSNQRLQAEAELKSCLVRKQIPSTLEFPPQTHTLRNMLHLDYMTGFFDNFFLLKHFT